MILPFPPFLLSGELHTGGVILFKLLRSTGRDDLLYSMTSQTDYPGWGFMKANGATTLWEMWEKDLPGHSLLHSSFLYPGAWYVDGIAGIRRDPESPGFRRFIVRPPSLTEAQMTWAKATYDSPVGQIKTRWERNNELLTREVTVSANTKATVSFPTADAGSIKISSSWAKRIGKEKGYTLYTLPAGNYTLSGREK